MEKYEELRNLVESIEADVNKFFNKGNKTAGIRLRKKMQEIRACAKEIRNEVQRKNDEIP